VFFLDFLGSDKFSGFDLFFGPGFLFQVWIIFQIYASFKARLTRDYLYQAGIDAEKPYIHPLSGPKG